MEDPPVNNFQKYLSIQLFEIIFSKKRQYNVRTKNSSNKIKEELLEKSILNNLK